MLRRITHKICTSIVTSWLIDYRIGCFVFSPFLKLKMLGVACDRVLGTDSKISKKIEMTSFRTGRPRFKLFSGGFPQLDNGKR